MKATYVEVNGEGREIFKDPITDDGTKKSATGLLQVVEVMESDSFGKLHHKNYELKDKVSWEEEQGGALNTIYKDGTFHNRITFDEIRSKLK
jgi:nicotinamide phosphoribosyltransferase